MAVLGLLAWRRLEAGRVGAVRLPAHRIYLTCQHPMLKNRFMHSWIAAVWVIGAVGLVYAVQQDRRAWSRGWRPWVAGLACTALIGLPAPALLEPAHAQEGGLSRTCRRRCASPTCICPRLERRKQSHHPQQCLDAFPVDMDVHRAPSSPEHGRRAQELPAPSKTTPTRSSTGCNDAFGRAGADRCRRRTRPTTGKRSEYVDLTAFKQVLPGRPRG